MNPIASYPHSFFQVENSAPVFIGSIQLSDIDEAPPIYTGIVSNPPPLFSVPQPEDLVSQLEKWLKWMNCPHYSANLKNAIYFNWLASLPSPYDSYWAEIPAEALHSLIHLIAGLCGRVEISSQTAGSGLYTCSSRLVHRQSALHFYFMQMTHFAIGHKVMARLYPEKMQGWGMWWETSFEQKVLSGEVFFDRGVLQEKLRSVVAYIKDLRSPTKGYMFDFPERRSIALPLDILEIASKELTDSPYESSKRVPTPQMHCRFLLQFLTLPHTIQNLLDWQKETTRHPYKNLEFLAYSLFCLNSNRPRDQACRSEMVLTPWMFHFGSNSIEYTPGHSLSCVQGAYGIKESPLLPQKQEHPLYCHLLQLKEEEPLRSENGDLCAQIEVDDQSNLEGSQHLLHTLAALAAPYNNHNRIALIIHWIEKNRPYLRNSSVQGYLYQLLLGKEGLQQASRYTIDDLRRVMTTLIRGLFEAPPKDSHHIVFWIRLGYFVESRLISKNRESDAQILFYQEMIDKFLTASHLSPQHRSEGRLTRILLHGHLVSISDQLVDEFTYHLLEAGGLLKEHKKMVMVDWLRIEAGSLMLRWQQLGKNFFEKYPGGATQWLNEKKIPGIPHISRKMGGSYPIYRLRAQALDLSFGWYEGGMRLDRGDWKRVFTDPSLPKVLGLKSEDSVEFDPDNEEFFTLDKSVHGFQVDWIPPQPLHRLDKSLFSQEEIDAFRKTKVKRVYPNPEPVPLPCPPEVTKCFSFQGLKGKYQYICLDDSLGPFYPYFRNGYPHWLSMDDKQHRHILILNNKNLPYAKLIPLDDEDHFACIKLDKDGNEQPERLVSFEKLSLPAQQKLEELISRRHNPDLLIWAKLINNAWVVTSIEVPSLSLSFTPQVIATGKVRLISNQHPEFYLLGKEEKKTCFLGEDALLYKKRGGEQFALIRFAANAGENPSFIRLTWHRKRKLFLSSEVKEQLLFISYLLSNGSYKAAYRTLNALQPMRSYNQQEYEIIAQALLSKVNVEHSLLSCHLVLHFLDNQQRFYENSTQDEGASQEISKKLIGHVQYLLQQLQGNEAIVHELGFSQIQIQTLLKLVPEAPIEFPTRSVSYWNNHAPYAPSIDSTHQSWMGEPLAALGQIYYNQQDIATGPSRFALPPPNMSDNLSARLYNALKEAHQGNCERLKTMITPSKEGKDALANHLKEEIKKDKKELKALEQKIKIQANANASYPLAIHDELYRSFLYHDSDFISQANPSLFREDVIRIWDQMVSMMLLQSRIDQMQEALLWTQKLTEDPEKNHLIHREIAKILSKKREYEISSYPELLAYEYATGFLLRPEQITLLQPWLEAEHSNLSLPKQAMIEFQAGGGKTKVIAPLLIYLAVQHKRLPIFVSLPAMYDILKHDLKESLHSIFDIKTQSLEIDLETPLSEEDLENIYNSLYACWSTGGALVIKPIVYHKLHMQVYHDIAHSPSLGARKIIAFFQKYAFLIVDEAHRNLMSTWQAIAALDPKPCLESEEQKLFILIYRLLMGVEPCNVGGIPLKEYTGLYLDKQSDLSVKERRKVLYALAEWLVTNHFSVPDESQHSVINYLYLSKAERPGWLNQMDPKQQQTFFLARGLLTQVIKTALQLRHEFDYGAPTGAFSIEMPRFSKVPTHAQFADPDLAAALTCQGLYQRGLDKGQFSESSSAGNFIPTLSQNRTGTSQLIRLLSFNPWKNSHLPVCK